jgi:hypothetical protein
MTTPESESAPEEVLEAAEAPVIEAPEEPQDPMTVLQSEMERWRDLAYRRYPRLCERRPPARHPAYPG